MTGKKHDIIPLIRTLALVLLVTGCSRREPPATPPAGETPTAAAGRKATVAALSLTSSAFAPGASIPAKHTCDGADVSPPLQWTGVPRATRSLALVCEDPDAPGATFVHWVLFNISPGISELPEGVPKTEVVFARARQGLNGFKRVGYGGPCPPPGSSHRYFFRLYALDSEPSLPPRATRQDLALAARGHVIAQGELMGKYQRK